MLRKINAGRIESDQGFSIQIRLPDILKYTMNNRVFEVNIGYDPLKDKIYVEASDSAKFYKMTDKEKDKMISNIKEAIKLLEGNFIVI